MRDTISVFEDALLAQNKSPITVRNYRLLAARFLASVPVEEEPFTKRAVNRFLAQLKRKGSSSKNMRWSFYGLKAFFTALEQTWKFKKTETPKVEDNDEVPVLNENLMLQMEEATKLKTKGKKIKPLALRNYSMIRLERLIGIRRIELQTLDIEDYVPGEGDRPAYIMVQTAKGGRRVMRELDPKTAELLSMWIRVLKRYSSRPDKSAIFTRGVRGPRLSLRGLNYIFRHIREDAGIDMDHAGFHAMRRGRVTDLHERGMSGPEITKEFGWKSPQTVNRYIRLSKGKIEEKLRNVHPMFNEDEFFPAAPAVEKETHERDQFQEPSHIPNDVRGVAHENRPVEETDR